MKKRRWFVFWVIIFVIICLSLLYIIANLSSIQQPLPISPSALKFIDDFNDGSDPNLIGGNQFIYISDKSFCRSLYNKAEIKGTSGFSCEISFYVPIDGWAIWGMDLNELDISAAKDLSFWVKGAKGGEEFELGIENGEKNKIGLDITLYANITKEWQQIIIPLSDFKDIDFNRLKSLNVTFRSRVAEKSGTIYIDDVAFRGEEEVFFNSLKDNLYGFPNRQLLQKRAKELLVKDDSKFLSEIAKDTWKYFRDAVDKRHGLPVDFIDISTNRRIGDYTSPTNIGLYFMAIISAYDLGFINKTEAVDRLKASLATLEALPKWNGLFYNYYSTTNLQIGREYISSVDNGWLAAGLIVLRQTFSSELWDICSDILKKMNFSSFYNVKLGQMSLGFDTKTKSLSPYHYGLLATEARLLSFIAISKNDVPKEHWFKIFRTLPKEWDWQNQMPEGETRRYLDVDVFEGYYTYEDLMIVPSWGGSLFEFLMPTLVIKEKEIAYESLGKNNLNAIMGHIKFADSKGYSVWGLSPCSTPDGSYGGYSEFGVAALGTKGYNDEGVVTPHVSFLSLYFTPKEAIDNIRKFLELYPMYGEFGLYDSVNVNTKMVSYNYLALDQGMILSAINNYLNNGILRERFHNDEFIVGVEFLLKMEKFF